MLTHQDFMSHAIHLAQKGLYTVRHNPRVACVLVKDHKIIGEGWHQVAGEDHAEILALTQAGSQAQDADCYLTLEPCTHYGKTPPCVQALIKAGIKRVFMASLDPNPEVHGKGVAQLKAHGIEVEVGLLAEEAKALNPGFYQRMQYQRPYIRAKMGMSLDGKIALANGKSQWITSEASRADVQHWRARSCAIVTSSTTVLADDPQLNVRDNSIIQIKNFKQPLRVVVDSHLRTKPTAKIYQSQDQARMVYQESLGLNSAWKAHESQTVALTSSQEHVDLQALMQWLAAQQLNEILVEAGSQFVGAFSAANLIDEWIIYIAPKFLGADAKSLLQFPALTELTQAINVKITECKPIGNDLRIIAKRA